MGSLFDLLRGEVVEIVDYATDHHKRTGNPPKLAVNANSWWHAGLSRRQIQEIRDRSGVHVNTAEVNILYYALRMLHLGIQLHFVFDGPRKSHNGRKIHPGHDPPTLLLRETLTKFAIPWHESPGEAEAECAKMEEFGIVDAVWSEDGDALAYGCKTLIRSYYEIKLATEKDVENKSFQNFQIFTTQETATRQPGMDQAGFILNALLTGGENGGIPYFEPRDVLRAARDGLGRSLNAASGSKPEFQKWVDTKLRSYLEDVGRDTDILKEFPTFEQLEDYTKPHVSTREKLQSIEPVQEFWDDEEKLFKFLANNFQWTIKRWAKWVVPLRIVRSLLATEIGEESQHDHLKFRCDLNKKPKKAKAIFVLAGATSLDLSALREEMFSIQTLTWILRRARLNGFAAITSYFTPPQSERASALGKGTVPPTTASNSAMQPPPFHITVGGSSQMRPKRARHITPPSPTPARRLRPMSSTIGAKTTKRIAAITSGDENVAIGKGKGKGKAKEVPTAQHKLPKRTRSSGGSGENTDLPNKRPKGAVIDLTSLPSSSESADCVLLTPQSSDEYGSVPSSQDLQALPIYFGAGKPTIVLGDTESEDLYGSFPSTPDIEALL